MPRWIDPTGQPTYGIALCARCNRKFPLADLFPDPNSPGLMVCKEDLDEYDPYRLPARVTEDITLPFVRPDVPLTDVGPVPTSGRPLNNMFLSGSGSVNLSWTQPSDPVATWNVYRSVDGGSFTLLASGLPATPRTYFDGTVDRTNHSYSYYVTYIDSTFGVESLPSNIVNFIKLSAIVAISVLGGTGTRVMRSVDGGTTWVNGAVGAAFPLPAAGQQSGCSMAWSASRGRLVAVSNASVQGSTAYSDDLGDTWTLVNKPVSTSNVSAHVTYAPWLDTFFLCGQFDSGVNFPVYKSTNGGQTWAYGSTIIGNGQPSNGIIAIPETQTLLCWIGNGLWRSSDGTTWSSVTINTAGQPHGEPSSYRSKNNYAPASDTAAWAGTGSGSVYTINPSASGNGVNTGVSFGGSGLVPMAFSPALGIFYALDGVLNQHRTSTSNTAAAWNAGVGISSSFPLGGAAIWTAAGQKFIVVGQRNDAGLQRGRYATSADGVSWSAGNISLDNDVNTRWGALIECA